MGPRAHKEKESKPVVVESREARKQKKFIRALKKRSHLRRKLLIRDFNVSSSQHLSELLHSRRELDELRRLQYQLNPSKYRYHHGGGSSSEVGGGGGGGDGGGGSRDGAGGGASARRGGRGDRRRERRTAEDDDKDSGKEEEEYKDSNVFLKGTQSANPHNDYCQHFVDTGQRPHNFIRDTGISERFREYPKLQELIRLKEKQITSGATAPMYQKCDLRTFDLTSLGTKFDVVLLQPPLEEYQRRASGVAFSWTPWEWEEIMALKVEEVAAQRSFVFLWCGSGEGLDLGRECLKKWGYRRCEDICWVKSNSKNPGKIPVVDQKAVLQNTKEHCLMGIKGTVRRNQDGHFIHANIDLDIIITEEPELGSTEKPVEIYHIIEHFCLGRRRLHLFGTDNTIRPGWLTLGPELTSSNFSKELYNSFFEGPNGYLLEPSEDIESLRPKTPPPRGGRGGGSSRGMGRGGLTGLGRGGTPRGGARGGRSF